MKYVSLALKLDQRAVDQRGKSCIFSQKIRRRVERVASLEAFVIFQLNSTPVGFDYGREKRVFAQLVFRHARF